jgi:hypothetical protein
MISQPQVEPPNNTGERAIVFLTSLSGPGAPL